MRQVVLWLCFALLAPPAWSQATAGGDGFSLRSADGNFQLKVRGYVQADARYFLDDDERPATDTFILRRVRPIFEGTLYKIFDFRIMPDFGGGQTVLQDAYIEGKLSPRFRVRAGKFKAPVGLERLRSGTDILFVERALPTNLVPNRDLGLQIGGDLGGGVASYAVGVFNGVPDGGSAALGDDAEELLDDRRHARLVLDAREQLIEAISPSHLRNANGSVVHTGDSPTGASVYQVLPRNAPYRTTRLICFPSKIRSRAR